MHQTDISSNTTPLKTSAQLQDWNNDEQTTPRVTKRRSFQSSSVLDLVVYFIYLFIHLSLHDEISDGMESFREC
jgi:hypothetical protein